MVISVSAETESHAKSKIRLSAETKITSKVIIHFRQKTETENACDLSLYRRLQLSTSYETIRSHSIRSALLGSLSIFLKYSHIGFFSRDTVQLHASSTPIHLYRSLVRVLTEKCLIYNHTIQSTKPDNACIHWTGPFPRDAVTLRCRRDQTTRRRSCCCGHSAPR